MSWLVLLAAALAQVRPDPGGIQRVRLTFANAGRTEDLVDFPVLVVLREGVNFEHARAAADGADLRFVDPDGVTVLPHDIELWNAAGMSTVWVSVPQIDAASDTDHVWLETGALPGGRPAATETWSGSAVVWHLRTFADATGNGHVLSENDDAVASVAGIAGPARALDGEDDVLVTPDHPDFSLDSFTVSAWVTVTAWERDFDGIVTKGDETFRLHRCLESEAVSFGVNFTDDSSRDVCSAVPIDDGGWHQVVGVYDRVAGLQTVYVDGVASGQSPEVRAPKHTDADVWIGDNQDYDYRDLRGQVDEVRIEPVARSAVWVSADHASVRNTLVRYCAPGLGLGDTDADGVCDEDDICADVADGPDADDDGFASCIDCDDARPDVHPDATDLPDNGIDEDCADGDATETETLPIDTADTAPTKDTAWPRLAEPDAPGPISVGCGCHGTSVAPSFLAFPSFLGWLRVRSVRRRAKPYRSVRGASAR